MGDTRLVTGVGFLSLLIGLERNLRPFHFYTGDWTRPADALDGRYSFWHGCGFSFLSLESLEGTYARRSFTPGTGRDLGKLTPVEFELTFTATDAA